MSGVFDAVASVVESVVEPVMDTVGGMVSNIMENPLKALPIAVSAYFSGGTSLALDTTEAAMIAADAASLAEMGIGATQIAETLQATYGIAAAEAANYAVAGLQVSDMAADAAQLLDQGLGQSQIVETLTSTYGVTPTQAAFYSLPIDAQNAYINAGMNPTAIGDQLLQSAKATDAFSQLPQAAQDAYTAAGYSPYEIGKTILQDTSGSNVAGMFSQVKDISSAVNTAKSVANVLGLGNAGTPGSFGTGLLSAGLGAVGSYLSGQNAVQAATDTSKAQVLAAQIAADAAKFKPVGVTTRFGTSQFGYDQAGNLTNAGYRLSPEVQAMQDKLMTTAGGMLDQYRLGQQAALPMGQAAESMMTLGQGYLATTPQQQAAKFMADQQALLAASRERDLSNLQNKLAQQGRLGLATGGTTTGMMAANPEMEAYYNAIRQQDLGLAAQATQGGQQYAQFGAGMVGSGGQMLRDMYGTQTAAYAPYQTAIGGAQSLEGLGQSAMDIGTQIGAKSSTAAANAGQLTAQGMLGSAQTMQQANAYSPWGSMLTGAGQMLQNYQTQQQQAQQQAFQNQLMQQMASQWGK